ncbi:3-hydroxyisobutyrate dehydrogenase [Endozoicomonas sp. (ex Bugula neritina AB1)]|nr:3-hydroxyisobutyrate dehydrogenase [Endozoicomonas sp. (ex Bugula neritina AB1)]
MEKIVFIGLGNMGGPMARNLIAAGYQVVGVDLSKEALQAHQDAGGLTAESVTDAVTDADVVISMLPAGKHVRALYQGNNGLLDKLSSRTLVIDCSTIESDVAKSVGAEATVKGISFIDAPVSGGTAGANAGLLTFMVGGLTSSVGQARPFLEVMGQNIFHAGDIGAGQVAKICNNMLLAILMTGTSEALKLGMDNGLKPEVLSDIMKSSSGGNWVLEKYNPVPGVMPEAPSSKQYQGGFMTGLMLKDLNLALSAAHESKTATPMGAMAENLYRMHASRAGEQLDFSSVIQLFEG